MKTIYKSLVLIAAAAFALSSCAQKENLEPSNANDLITLKFNINNADNGAETKALLGTENGKNFLDWEDGDQIGTYSVGSFGSNSSTSNNNAGTVEVSGDSYTLNVQVNPNGNITNIYSYYPHSASAGKDKTAAIVTIPESQIMNAEGFDADAMPMAGEPVEVSLTSVPANTDTPCGTIYFSNLGSIINFKVYSSAATDETLTSVKYITSGNIGGAFSIDLTGVDASNESTLALTPSNAISEITTTYTTRPAIGTGKSNAIDVYMVVAPGTYSSTQVVVTTSAHTYTLTASGDKTYERSHVKPMNVDIKKGVVGDLPKAETWTKVTSSSEFTAGTYYILRGDGAYYLPNAVASSGAPACVAYSATGTIPNSMRWTATAGESGLIFESASNSGKYLWGWAKNDGIRITDSSPATGASKEWTFNSLTVSETTYYTASAVSGRYLISYGVQDWRNYSSGSATNIPAEFYKLVDNRSDSGIEWSEAVGMAEITTEGIDYVLPTLTNPHSLTVSYSSSDPTVATINASTGEVTAVAAGETIISAVFAGDATYKPITAEYTLSVTDRTIVANNGSLEHPYTASEAKELALGGDTGSYYISGIVTKVQNQYSASYGTANFWIDENGSATDVFEGYKIKYFGNVNWVDGNAEIAVNDEVIIYGTLTIYNNTVAETSSGYLVSLNGKTKGLTPGSLTTTADDENKQITVTWGAATGTESTINYLVTCDTQTYNSSAAGSHTFTMADYGTYNVSVVVSADDAVSGTTSTTATITDPSGSTPTLQYTLDGTVTGGSNGYATESEITQSSISWKVTGNTTTNPWRIGGKSLTNENRAIYSTDAISSNISSIEVASGTSTLTSVNSLTITVHSSAEDAASGDNAIATKTVTTGITGSIVTLPKSDNTSWAGKYYRIVYNVSAGSSNSYVQFISAKFYGTN